ncbi:unnamed protein product [Pylaiella littoralis]
MFTRRSSKPTIAPSMPSFSSCWSTTLPARENLPQQHAVSLAAYIASVLVSLSLRKTSPSVKSAGLRRGNILELVASRWRDLSLLSKRRTSGKRPLGGNRRLHSKPSGIRRVMTRRAP